MNINLLFRTEIISYWLWRTTAPKSTILTFDEVQDSNVVKSLTETMLDEDAVTCKGDEATGMFDDRGCG